MVVILNIFLDALGIFTHGTNHPMKPFRVRMTHNLVMNYGLCKKMEIFVSKFIYFFHFKLEIFV